MSDPPPAGCGPIPQSAGPASSVASLRVDGPKTARSGSELTVQVAVVVRADGGRIITDPDRSSLLVTAGGRIVGRSARADPSLPVPLQLSAGAVRPAQVVPLSVRLVDCGGGTTAAGTPLPAGSYGVVAVLGYGADSLNGAAGGGSSGRFQLVSEPAPITVT